MQTTVLRSLLAASLAVLAGCSTPLITGGGSGAGLGLPRSTEIFSGPVVITDAGPSGGARTLSVQAGRSTRLALLGTSEDPVDVRVDVDGGDPTTSVASLGLRGSRDAVGRRAFEDVAAPVRVQDPARLRRRLQQMDPDAQVGDRATFWVIRPARRRGSSDVQVATTAAYVGKSCEVWIDDRLGGDLDQAGQEIGKAFDTSILPKDHALFGPAIPPAGAPSRVALLISPDVNNGGRDATIGYFTARDLLKPDDAPEIPELSKSNQRMILYMAADVVDSGRATEYLGTVAHEYQHLINASRKLFGPAASNATEDTWLDEGLSMYAMQANGYGIGSDAEILTDHVHGYLEDASSYSLTDWRYNPGQSGYGASYLFVTYLVDRFGADLLRELVDTKDVGIANVDARLQKRGTTFREVFRDWAIANMLTSDAGVDARYQYKTFQIGSVMGADVTAVRSEAVVVPGGGTLSLLPWSASYLALTARTDQPSLQLSITGADAGAVDALLVAPR